MFRLARGSILDGEPEEYDGPRTQNGVRIERKYSDFVAHPLTSELFDASCADLLIIESKGRRASLSSGDGVDGIVESHSVASAMAVARKRRRSGFECARRAGQDGRVVVAFATFE